jgi:sugar phosphate isomerase/epimerase
VTLQTAEITRPVLDEVGSPWIRADYDSANWITLDTIFDADTAISRDMETLGRYIFSAHAEDIWIEDRLTLHLQDCCPGKGRIDFQALFRRMEALSPDYPVIAEGNNSDEPPEVGRLFHTIARELAIPGELTCPYSAKAVTIRPRSASFAATPRSMA